MTLAYSATWLWRYPQYIDFLILWFTPWTQTIFQAAVMMKLWNDKKLHENFGLLIEGLTSLIQNNAEGRNLCKPFRGLLSSILLQVMFEWLFKACKLQYWFRPNDPTKVVHLCSKEKCPKTFPARSNGDNGFSISAVHPASNLQQWLHVTKACICICICMASTVSKLFYAPLDGSLYAPAICRPQIKLQLFIADNLLFPLGPYCIQFARIVFKSCLMKTYL